MPINKTINFLPAVFQSETNRKFLNATLDQLTTESNLKPINGYVGRKFTPGFSGIDGYIKEPTAERANYQLEPSVVVKDSMTGDIEFRTSYVETLQQIGQLRGRADNQDRIWSNEFYSYDPKINLDAFVNFGQYYWLPTGPDVVDVFSGGTDLEKTFYVYPNNGTDIYNINGYGTAQNPDIVLARGGTYKFHVKQKGKPFWIQTNPGLTGQQTGNQNLSSRQIFGVKDNGTDVGEVVFTVPTKDAQDFFVNMPVVQSVDYAISQTYAQMQGQVVDDFITAYGGFDGQANSIDGKYIIFSTYSVVDADWTADAITVPVNQRYGVWQASVVGGVINLSFVTGIPVNNKVLVVSGLTNGNTEWYKNTAGGLEKIVPITATLDVLYYQDGVSINQWGTIKLVDVNDTEINVTSDILGKQNYVSPNGVTFTNGLKIKFDNSATPAEYKNTEFYVDGVGNSITLTPVNSLTINFAQSRSSFDPTSNFTGIAAATLNPARDQLTITSSDVPGNGVAAGTFPNTINNNYIIDQDLTLVYPYRGGLDTQGDHSSLLLNSSTIGVTVAGILINGVANNWYLQGGDGTVWHYDAAQTLVNGQDIYGGAPETDGSYVYRDSTFITANAWGNVSGFEGGSYIHADGHSKLIGYAEDGYPIYGPFGYMNASDANSGTIRMTSSYTPNNNGLGRPSPVTVTVSANATASTLLTVSSTFGINPGMRITTNSGGIPAKEFWVINNGLHTAVGPKEFTNGTNQIQLNKEITIPAGTTVTFEFLAGAFIEDYEFVPNSGLLDQFNGRYCVTPEFPAGTYAYFATQDINGTPIYPYFVGSAFYGSVDVDVNTSLTTPDYIVINRSSRDLNPWTRRNRWFHKDVIAATAIYNNTVPVYDQNNRAVRPIIEFKPNMQLFDYGTIGLAPIDLYDTRFTNPFMQIEGQRGIVIDGVDLVDGMRLIFANAADPDVSGKIWVANFVDIAGNGNKVLNLTVASDGVPAINDTVSVFNGVGYVGKSFWFNGTMWVEGQTKDTINQPPRFDVFDSDGISYGDTSKYPVSDTAMSFKGTKIFGYKLGTGSNDTVLGFPLSYKAFNNVGDIQFQNYFDTDTFLYTIDRVDYTDKVNTGFLHENNADGTTTKLNAWTTVKYMSKQYQDIPYVYDGINNTFNIDILPDANTDTSNLQVFVNYKRVPANRYQLFSIPTNRLQIVIDPLVLTDGDKVDIFVYNSKDVSSLGFYEVPDNLNYNAQNLVLSTPSLGEMRNHVSAMANNSLDLIGDFPGSSNLRDLNVNNLPGTMLQHSAPVSFASMFLGDTKHNFVDSLFNAQHEYTRFKNKVMTIVSSMPAAAYTDASDVVDDIIKQINIVKNKNFAWYYSDMVPYGDNKNTLTYNVFDPAQRRYEITEIFSMATLSNKACLVYINGVQVIYGTDYVFLTTAPGIEFTADVMLEVGDTVTIVEYHNTDGNWIPETPTKLGLYPKYIPQIYVDNTYIEPTTFIKGHDGSLTPAFGDFRDDVLLELERRIYNNIKVVYDDAAFNVANVTPGKFRDTGFTLTEFNNVILKTYLQWAGLNRLDYITNDTFQTGNSFTYNYGKSIDNVNGDFLPGSWRACFEYFYDTQRPNTNPWEMLGFSDQPSWWENVYGPAPYTSGNTILWNDLEAGYIADGDRQGYDIRFRRPGLSKIIPVNEAGELLSPIGLLTGNYSLDTFSDRWTVGQWSPVETAWRNSSEYPFAIMYAAAVMQPAKFFAIGIARQKYTYNKELKQYIVSVTNQHLTSADVDVNGYISATNTVTRTASYLNWIGDHLISQGASSLDSLLHFVRDYDVRLTYRMAGFSSKQNLKVLANQFSPNSINESIIVPDSDYDLVLTKSAPLTNLRYSGVIIERTTSGFVITGYDTLNPYFTIVPYMQNSESKGRELVVLNESVIYPTVFTDYKISIPYGTEFATLQQVVNFLASYERFLKSQGFQFDIYDQKLGQIRNWELSSKEFLFWVQQGWTSGNMIVLSPVSNVAIVRAKNATVDAIQNSFYGSKVMTQNFAILNSDAYSVIRDTSIAGNAFQIKLENENDLIAFLDIDMVQFEHTLVFNNSTQFGDIIYNPIMGERQFRLKLVGSKTNEWTGVLSAPGFVYSSPNVDLWHQDTDYLKGDLVEYKGFYYTASKDLPGTTAFEFQNWLPVDKNKIKTGLVNSFARNASMSIDFYNVDKVNIESEFDKYALGLIGYRNRSYLSDIGLDDTTQVKLYQGFIQQKGTRNAIDALGTVGLNGQNTVAEISEEWAFRVGAYGSLETNQYVELVLDEDTTLNNPTSLQVLNASEVTYSSLITKPSEVYKTSNPTFSTPFLLNRTENSNRSDDIQTSGFVNIEDVDYTVFDISKLDSTSVDLLSIGIGSTLWVAKDYNQDWNVYRVSEPQVNAVKITNALDGKLRITTDKQHNLMANDTIMLPIESNKMAGFYKVESVADLTSFLVKFTGSLVGFGSMAIFTPVYPLKSLKFEYASDVAANTPVAGWKTNSKAWIQNNNSNNEWAVYNKTEPWVSTNFLNVGNYSSGANYGTSVYIEDTGNFVLVGKPGYNNGKGAFVNYLMNFGGVLSEDVALISAATNVSAMGYSLDSGVGNVAVGAPSSSSNTGYVFTYSRDYTGKLSKRQILAPNVASGQFGFSVSMSNDDRWLYVGAPGVDQVFVYAYDESVTEHETTTTKTGNTAPLSFVPESAELIFVANASADFVPYVDYTVVGSNIVFNNSSDSGLIEVVQRPGYRYITSLTGQTGSQFGHSVASSTDGAQIVIGAPETNLIISNTSVASGTVSVYDRSIEKIIARDNATLFTATTPVPKIGRVLVNNVPKVLNEDYIIVGIYSIKFVDEVAAGSIIQIETDVFTQLQTLQPAEPYPNQNFGFSVDICPNNCSIYVGAPAQSNAGFYNGAVYRFVNQARVYGTITGSNLANHAINPGDSIRINDFPVVFNDTSLASIIDAINKSGIPGISATNTNGYLTINSSNVVNFNKLTVLPGVGSAINALGFDTYPETQTILSPANAQYDFFGKKVKVDQTGAVLFVGSDKAGSVESTMFDSDNTLFDAGSTAFIEYLKLSGAVWTYSYLDNSSNDFNNPGQFIFVQQIKPAVGLSSGYGYGSDIAASTYGLIIGANTDSRIYQGAGQLYQFTNPTKLKGWDVYRFQEPKIELDAILKGYIYSTSNQVILNTLDYIDPAKGKILGVAEQDITFKTDYDPALYNNATLDTVSLNESLHWTDAQVGQVWWDISAVRFLDYEQGSIKYRTANWGRTFPGSSIDVYEWVESNYPPSQYVARGGDGLPKYGDDSAYATVAYVDPQSNQTVVKYYFWVKDKTTVTQNQFGRTIPTTTIANYISSPQSSGITYFAAIRDDSIAIYNVLDKITGTDTVFHIDYATQLNHNIIHSEYALLSETTGRTNSIPQAIYNKLVDSASGSDIFGNPVPDPLLPAQSRYGISVRPRQSMFMDKNEAIKEMVTYANSVFSQSLISQGFNLDTLSSAEELPVAGTGVFDIKVSTIEELGYINIIILPVGYKVLVVNDSGVDNLWTVYTKQPDNTWLLSRVQSYRTSDYWQFVDWYATGFDKTTKPDFTVKTFADLSNIPVKAQNIVKVLNNGRGKWVLVQVFPNIVTTIGIQDGTIALTENLYNLEAYGMGFGNDNFGTKRFDQNPSIEIRKILQALHDDLFVNQLSGEFLRLFFVFVYYVLNEQKYIDWAFKTSFINVLHKTRGLDQPQIYNKDNQSYYLNYIEEVKPYRSTIREYIMDYQGVDNFTGYVTDFDVPAYYDPVLQQYRSPSGEFAEDAKALQDVKYNDWLSSYSYVVGSIDVVNGGSGYTIPPQVIITGSTIGNDAVARAIITGGVVTKIEVLYSGTNYITTPVVTVNGGNGSGATAHATLKNETTRKLKTTLVYDRVTYGSNVKEWAANTSYAPGDILTYNGVAYVVNANFTSSSTFLGNDLSIYPASKFKIANDRIQAYYTPEVGSTGKDFGLLQNGVEYPGVTIEGPMFVDSGGFDVATFDQSPFDPLDIDSDGTYVISDSLLDTKLDGGAWGTWPADGSIGTSPDEIVVDGGGYVDTFSSHAPEELLPGRVYDTLDLTVTTFSTFANSSAYSNWVATEAFYVYEVVLADGGLGYTASANAALGESNISVTVEGTTGTGATVNYSLDENGSITGITVLNSGYRYTTIPNIVITGSNIAPARASARLAQNDYSTFSYRMFKDMNDNVTYLKVPTASTTLAANLNWNDANITVTNASVLPEPNAAGAVPGVVIINGERITYYTKDNASNTLGQIRRGTAGTGARNHAVGAQVVPVDVTQIVPLSSNYVAVVDSNVDVVLETTASLPYTFLANVEYTQSVLWYNQGVGPDTLEVEFITNVAANVMTTESLISLSTDQENIPRASDGNGLYASNKVQALFVSHG
jgi:hypothetical protein